MADYVLATFIRSLPSRMVRKLQGEPIECLCGEVRGNTWAVKGTNVLIRKFPALEPGGEVWYQVFFNNGRVLRMRESAASWYLKTERKGGKVVRDNERGALLAANYQLHVNQ